MPPCKLDIQQKSILGGKKMMNVEALFCKLDDFEQDYESKHKDQLVSDDKATRNRKTGLSRSEIMTILILFQMSAFRHLKAFYTTYVCVHMRKEFPGLLSYNRFIQLIPRVIVVMLSFLYTLGGKITGISFVDSTPIAVCHMKRANRNKAFKGIAELGKCTMGWFFGFKLHLIVNDQGEILNFALTKGNVDDRVPLDKMTTNLIGKLFGDRGYISAKKTKKLLKQGLRLITSLGSNMKNKLLPMADKLLLRKRFIIETINDQLKNISQIEHSRHRSPVNFLLNLFAGLIAYQLQPKKPSLNFSRKQLAMIS